MSLLALMLGLGAAVNAAAQVELEPYLRRDTLDRIKISPDGLHYAASVPMEDRTGMIVMRRSDKKVISSTAGVKDSVVADFWWVNNERLVLAMAETQGRQDPVYFTGELFGVGLQDKEVKKLFGKLARPGMVQSYGADDREMATLIDQLPGDPDNILIAAWPLSSTPRTRVEKLNVYTGRSTVVATTPVSRASFTVDASGQVRFADGASAENHRRLYYREGDGAAWQLINDQGVSGREVSALGLSADGSVAYLQTDQQAGPDVIETMDLHTLKRSPLLRDAVVDPYQIIRSLDGRTPIGVQYMDGHVRSRFFDEESDMASTYRRLEKAFPGSAVSLSSSTRDGSVALLKVWDDRTEGDYYLYDMQQRSASGVFARNEWLLPETLPITRPVSLQARDGVRLHGYVTKPLGQESGLPMLVVPHGGPFGLFDRWAFDLETQMLAKAGYAVLRINYRGSGNYGGAFQKLGAQQWGGRMQDDLTDATRWAIDQGIADPDRICLYGASYGGYAALVGVAKEPALYRCAVGYVGVYDLEAVHSTSSSYANWARNWSNDWVGARGDLAALSPVNMADRIKVPVLLVAGGADARAPMQQSRAMERALRARQVPVETLYVSSEGHGFTTQAHQRRFYTQLLDFLHRQLGGQKAAAEQ